VNETVNKKPPVIRLIIGGIFFVIGLICPVFIPLVIISDMSVGLKTLFSGLLALGIPELLWLVAISILGKPGYEYLKSVIFQFFKKYGPPSKVNRNRYRIGLVLFILPLISVLSLPYLKDVFPFYQQYALSFNISIGVVFLISLFILGGEFWNKLRSLFLYDAKVILKSK
jgi:hypothetical protein